MQSYDITEFAKLLMCKADESPAKELLEILNQPGSFQSTEHLGYIESPLDGISIMFKDEKELIPTSSNPIRGIYRVDAIHLYAEGIDDYRQYPGLLLDGIHFNSSREQVRQRLGEPDDSGGGNPGIGGELWPYWDRYDLENFSLRFQFDQASCKSIQIVTIMLPVQPSV